MTFEREYGSSTPPERPSPIPEVTWGLRDLGVGIVLALVVFFAVSGAIIGIAWALFGQDTLEFLVAQALTIVVLDIVLVAAVLFVVGRKGAGWRQLGFRGPGSGTLGRDAASGKGLIGLIVIAYVASLASVYAYGFLISLAGFDELMPGQQLPDDFFDHAIVIAIIGVAVVLMAPVAEEIFFRGFFFAGLRRYMGLVPAGLLSGVLFAVAHGDPGLIVPFALVGGILAYTYERSGTLLAPIGVHFLFNAVSFFILVFVPEAR